MSSFRVIKPSEKSKPVTRKSRAAGEQRVVNSSLPFNFTVRGNSRTTGPLTVCRLPASIRVNAISVVRERSRIIGNHTLPYPNPFLPGNI